MDMPRTRLLRHPILLVVASFLGCSDQAESPTQPVLAAAPALTAAASEVAFTLVSVGAGRNCGVAADQRGYCWNDERGPILIPGGLRWLQLSAGGTGHVCGIATDNLAYCFGPNFAGQLGDGTTTTRDDPVPVFGGRRFRSIRAGGFHTCAVTFDDRAYCWGKNSQGETGDSSTSNRRERPKLVAGQHAFRQVVTGWTTSCGVTTDDRAFCWGNGSDGQIGDGKTIQRNWPRAVAGGLSFRVISVGSTGTCAITTGTRREGLLLGRQRPRPGRRRHHHAASQAGPGGRGPAVSPHQPRRVAHLRHDHGRQGLLLGRQRRRCAGRRHPDRPPDAGGGRRRARPQRGERRHDQRGHGLHLRSNQRRPCLLLGLQLLRPTGRTAPRPNDRRRPPSRRHSKALPRIANRPQRRPVRCGRGTFSACVSASRSTPGPISSGSSSPRPGPSCCCASRPAGGDVAFAVYGGTLVLLYAASTLYHALPLPARAAPPAPNPGPHRDLLPDRRDVHARGAASPCAVAGGRALLAAGWTIAVAGIPFKIRWLDAPVWLSTGDLSGDGVHGAVGGGAAGGGGRAGGLTWLVAGGLAYTVGAIIFAVERPNPCPVDSDTTRSGTSWCCVGSGCHFGFVLLHVAMA